MHHRLTAHCTDSEDLPLTGLLLKQTFMPATLPDTSNPIQAAKEVRNLFGIYRLISGNGADQLVA